MTVSIQGTAARARSGRGAEPTLPGSTSGTCLGAVPLLRRLALEAADRACLGLAAAHYENFTSVSRLASPADRVHLARVYAFCRVTDDLGDEATGDRTEALLAWREATRSALEDGAEPAHPVLLALRETALIRRVPARPFLDLVDANLQDQRIRSYRTWEDLLDYCRLSAVPVGRMVLAVLGIGGAAAEQLSDDVCVGLQLANFAQDVAVDRDKGRTYLVLSDVDEAGVAGALGRMCDRAERLLSSGEALEEMATGRARVQLSLYRLGGLAIVDAVRRGGFTTDQTRPTVAASRKAALAAAALPVLASARYRPGAAEARCAEIARRHAANFYWGFVALPAEQRHSIYALYAFARQLDDAVDDHGAAEGVVALRAQRERLRDALAGAPDDEVTGALLQAVRRHAIPGDELEDLVAGVERDLTTRRYATWEELRDYCSLVASTIGRMCVRVFGFTDTAALERADELGVAMQLVNVLRDVREDAARDRVYLPAEDLERAGLAPGEVLGGDPGPGWERLVALEIERARGLFASGLEVTDHLSRRASACVRTMAGIYQAIADDIEREPRSPLRRRVSLSRGRKLSTMARAWW